MERRKGIADITSRYFVGVVEKDAKEELLLKMIVGLEYIDLIRIVSLVLEVQY